MSKRIGVKSLILNYGRGMTGLMLNPTHVDGGGLRKDAIKESFGGRAVRIAYSKLVPGLLVVHYLDERVGRDTVLQHFKFYHSRQSPRKLDQRLLIDRIIGNAATYGITLTPEQIEEDFLHMAYVPVEGEDFYIVEGPAPEDQKLVA